MTCSDCKYLIISINGLFCPKIGVPVDKNESACSLFKEVKDGNKFDLQRLHKEGLPKER